MELVNEQRTNDTAPVSQETCRHFTAKAEHDVHIDNDSCAVLRTSFNSLTVCYSGMCYRRVGFLYCFNLVA